MSEIEKRLESDLRSALKAGDRLRVSTLRMVSSELKNRRIELGRDLADEDAIEVLVRERKRRAEAEEQFRKGGREELAGREAAEAAVIAEYLPEPMSDEELDRLIDEAIAESGATGPEQMGMVMGLVMPRVKGRAEGAAVSRRVRERLS